MQNSKPSSKCFSQVMHLGLKQIYYLINVRNIEGFLPFGANAFISSVGFTACMLLCRFFDNLHSLQELIVL